MKTNLKLVSIAVILVFSATLLNGCKKDSTTSNSLTADDAADAITNATASSTGGLSAQTSAAVSYSYSQGAYKTGASPAIQSLSCGVPLDTTITLTYTGASTASYTGQWDYTLTCKGAIPESVALTGDFNGQFNAPVIQASDSGTRNWTITGLDGTLSTPYTLNGSYTRTGTYTSKVRNKYTYTVNMTITLTNVTVSKSTYEITGGSGGVTMTGSVSNGNSYTFNGGIVFNGGGTATLTINGSKYNINL